MRKLARNITVQLANDSAKRFLSKIRINGECWNWSAATTSDGYGRIKIAKHIYSATRLSYVLFNQKEISINMDLCHKCDNPRCVNPEHLFIGTRSDNMLDCSKKHRLYKVTSNDVAQGEKNGNAKLTNEMAKEIRLLYASGVRGKKLCERFPIHKTNVYRAIKGISYKIAV